MIFLYEDFIGSIFANMNLPKLTNRRFFHLKMPFIRNPSTFTKKIKKKRSRRGGMANQISPMSK